MTDGDRIHLTEYLKVLKNEAAYIDDQVSDMIGRRADVETKIILIQDALLQGMKK